MADKQNLVAKLWSEVEYLRGIMNTNQVEALEIRRKTAEFYKQQK